ncbi:MAG TPA: chloride channel protein, partial [Kofleriaceae bacterium]|nr:chloride channel protein [Kofleriaceae bacterium]
MSPEHSGQLPVAPSLDPTLASVGVHAPPVDRRVVLITLLAVGVAAGAAIIARVLTALIGLITNLSFYGRWGTDLVSPADSPLGWWIVVIPIAGSIIVGFMARYGSAAIRGHGIPEAMEQVLTNESRIPVRMTFLKPISAAIAIGTGGPFGAEGPIIATGGAIGSVLGQAIHVSANERKTLLAAGAAAGMTATFGTPVAAVLLAIELLLFEYRARSLVPVAFACVTAQAMRSAAVGLAPVFAMPQVPQLTGEQIAIYCGIGVIVGIAAVGVTRLIYWIEDMFEHLPVHWMWWPAIGAIAVGLVGVWQPHTLGVGYDNIERTLQGSLEGQTLAVLVFAKLVSWSISLGSGTSGGTLAPLFTMGGGVGALLAAAAGVDPRVGALVGMAAMFAGASRALLASVVFAFETTRQPLGLLPLLGGCSAAYLVSCLVMPGSIMTEKLRRRGLRVPEAYGADLMDQIHVGDQAHGEPVVLDADHSVASLRPRMDRELLHHGYPVASHGKLLGVVTRHEVIAATDETTVGALVRRPAVTAFPDETLRAAVERMLTENVGRLIVVSRE